KLEHPSRHHSASLELPDPPDPKHSLRGLARKLFIWRSLIGGLVQRADAWGNRKNSLRCHPRHTPRNETNSLYHSQISTCNFRCPPPGNHDHGRTLLPL